jgi:hypothetical protein
MIIGEVQYGGESGPITARSRQRHLLAVLSSGSAVMALRP